MEEKCENWIRKKNTSHITASRTWLMKKSSEFFLQRFLFAWNMPHSNGKMNLSCSKFDIKYCGDEGSWQRTRFVQHFILCFKAGKVCFDFDRKWNHSIKCFINWSFRLVKHTRRNWEYLKNSWETLNGTSFCTVRKKLPKETLDLWIASFIKDKTGKRLWYLKWTIYHPILEGKKITRSSSKKMFDVTKKFLKVVKSHIIFQWYFPTLVSIIYLRKI